MSLTSYRAAPPRVMVWFRWESVSGLVRFGGDLLSHVLRRSTIGAAALNGRVRDGIGCFARAVATKPEKPERAVPALTRRPTFGNTRRGGAEAGLRLSVMKVDCSGSCSTAWERTGCLAASACLLPDRI